mgnify:FL=1
MDITDAALAKRLRVRYLKWRQTQQADIPQALLDDLAAEALAFVAERLPTEDHLDELVKRAWTGACPHGKKKLGPCRSCSILRIREALLRDLRGRLGGKDG